MGGLPEKKGKKGSATAYISRKQALKKLQISLKDFRRICILKGIYPTEPKQKGKVNKKNSLNKTYFFMKDIQFLLHEPVIEKFRAFKIFVRRLKRAIGRKDQESSKRIQANPPTYRLDHIVRERYPTFNDAVKDIEDALSMCFLFSTMPKGRILRVEMIQLCRKLTVEFMHYVVQSRSLRKVFISIKGYYYQADIMGETVNWIVPHALGYSHPTEVDFKIMATFTDFYSTMLGFVNFKLYHSLNLIYPPKLAVDLKTDELLCGEEDSTASLSALNHNLAKAFATSIENEAQPDDFSEFDIGDDQEETKEKKVQEEKFKKLFEKCRFFLNREVPHESLTFIIRSFGGEVSFDKTVSIGATFDESDLTITHHVIDRPSVPKPYMNRYYVQPQWVYDSINARMLLPVEDYFVGESLPPHLSPFVEEKEGDYVPPERLVLMKRKATGQITKGEKSSVKTDAGVTSGRRKREVEKDSEDDEEEDQPKKKILVVPGSKAIVDPERAKQMEDAEEKRLALMMMPKKRKHLYDKIIYGQKRKRREVQKLKDKREAYDMEQKS